ncbi:GNAT family N-acetyltransferase [Paeniclostridium sp. NSJ-45]|uniref:GNAT family N-acetyltransferase n=1 Tax=Paeniclostridium hominis TaxID=2764329 RepID=A0ABR7K3N8_9FIRM|nr:MULTISPECIES: GNAT family N-acetyltransferase [Paeniclostridium]MBC6003690.1 GNAT family N-acetyltransferase [Paeniclostridium hominis]
MKHKGTKRIETENLILRKFELSDAKAMYENWASDSEVTKFLTWKPIDSIEVSKHVIKSWIDEYENENFYQWAITLKSYGDDPIGCISIVRQDEEIGMVQVGYCIGKKWWNQGITSEALKALIKYFITEVKANRIEARHDPLNLNSGKVMKKCKMKYEGTMRKADINNQGICDYSMYALLAEDYISEDF